MRNKLLLSSALFAMALCGPAHAGMDEAKAFLDTEINGLSSLSRADQEKEMQWFVDAAKPLAGMEIKVVSEQQVLLHKVLQEIKDQQDFLDHKVLEHKVK